MARFPNPITDMKPNGSLRFFKSGTNSILVTYKDELETPGLENPVIVPVLANGNVQNIFFSGSAKVIYLDEFGVQYAERDPVGGDRELGDFALWDAAVTYDINDIVETTTGKFYQSLSNGNVGNDPTLIATSWKEIRFIEVWNTNVTYALGDIVQTTDGNLWKAKVATVSNDPSTDSGANWLPAVEGFIGIWNINITYSIGDIVQTGTGNLWKALTASAGNDPESDDGTNWLPAIDGAKIPEIIKLTWVAKSVGFTAIENESYQIDGSSNTVDVTMPTLVEGKSYTFHNESTSTFKVQILNPSNTINGPSGSFAAGTDIELQAGDSVQMVAKSTSILEIVGAQV